MNSNLSLSSIFENLRSFYSFSRTKKGRLIWYGFAAIIYALIVLSPLPGFSPEAKRALGVFGVAVFLWATDTLPLPVTGLLILFLLPISGAISSKDTYAFFGDQAVFFILGALILTSPIMRSGLSTRLALAVVSRFGNNVKGLLASILLLAAGMSCVINAHAVAAMLFPIVLEVVRAAGGKPGGRFGFAAFVAMAWGGVIGSNTTLLGGARGPLALGILQNATKSAANPNGMTISFAEWTLYTIPIVIVLLLLAVSILITIGPGENVSLPAARRFLESRNKQLGPISRREIYTTCVMVLTVVLWVFEGDQWGLATVGFLGVTLAFILGVAKWHEVEEDVNWGIFIMYGSAIALSAAMRETGAAEALSKQLLALGIEEKTVIFAIIVLSALVLTEFMSNAATVAMMMPVALSLAINYGIDPRAMTLGVVVTAGLGFMFPVSTPAIAIAVSSGFVRPTAIIRLGIWLDILTFVIVFGMSKLYWPLVGLRW